MSAPSDYYKHNSDEDQPSHDDEEKSNDGTNGQSIDRPRFPAALSYRSDAQYSDTATVCSETILDDIEVESILSAQDDVKHHIASTSPAVAASSTHATEDRSSIPISSGDMFPPLNRALLLDRDFVRSPSVNNTQDRVSFQQCLLGYDRDDVAGEHAYDTAYHKSQTTAHIHSDNFPVATISNSLNNAIRRYIDDVKPQAPSSVKSFGSNVGSDDCGGSLDVETHSIGARSIHSQEDVLPVAMPDPDPGTEAVALLSINPVDPGEMHRSGGNVYRGGSARQQNGQYMHLTLQRFHDNQIQFDNFDDDGVERTSGLPLGNDPQSISLSRENEDRIPNIWNDPRIDQENRRQSFRRDTSNSTRQRSRSRSRSRSPHL